MEQCGSIHVLDRFTTVFADDDGIVYGASYRSGVNVLRYQDSSRNNFVMVSHPDGSYYLRDACGVWHILD